jgi:hypothetical protein
VLSAAPLEQLSVTRDETDYLFYETNVVDLPPGAPLTWNGWRANTYSIFIDGQFVGSQNDDTHALGPVDYSFNLPDGYDGPHTLTILSGSLGLDSAVEPGPSQENKGIVGSVFIEGINVTSQWIQRPFLTGEILSLYTQEGTSKVSWTEAVGAGVSTPLTWYKTQFSTPSGTDSVVLNMQGASRGHFYVNGIDMGRCDCVHLVCP